MFYFILVEDNYTMQCMPINSGREGTISVLIVYPQNILATKFKILDFLVKIYCQNCCNKILNVYFNIVDAFFWNSSDYSGYELLCVRWNSVGVAGRRQGRYLTAGKCPTGISVAAVKSNFFKINLKQDYNLRKDAFVI